MREQLGDLSYSIKRDSGALLHGQRVIGRLEYDVRPIPYRLGMHVRLEVQRGHRIRRKLGGQPAEVRRFPLPPGYRPQLGHAGEVFPAERDPHAPLEVLVGIDNGKDQPSPNEIVLRLDDADLVLQAAALVASEIFMPVRRRR